MAALKWEKSAISKVQKHIFCNFKKVKKSIFAPEKSLKLPKILFFQNEYCIFGNFKLSSGSKIDFLPFLKLQKMDFGQKRFFRDIDLFDFTSFFGLDFFKFSGP